LLQFSDFAQQKSNNTCSHHGDAFPWLYTSKYAFAAGSPSRTSREELHQTPILDLRKRRRQGSGKGKKGFKGRHKREKEGKGGKKILSPNKFLVTALPIK